MYTQKLTLCPSAQTINQLSNICLTLRQLLGLITLPFTSLGGRGVDLLVHDGVDKGELVCANVGLLTRGHKRIVAAVRDVELPRQQVHVPARGQYGARRVRRGAHGRQRRGQRRHVFRVRVRVKAGQARGHDSLKRRRGQVRLEQRTRVRGQRRVGPRQQERADVELSGHREQKTRRKQGENKHNNTR